MAQVTAVEKIGGSSLPNEEAFGKHAKFLARRVQAGERLVVVISAQKGYTDRLLNEAKSLFESDTQRANYVLQGGEICSAYLLRDKLRGLGIINTKVVSYEDIELVARGGDVFNSDLVSVGREKLAAVVDNHDVTIVPGYGAIHEILAGVFKYVLLGRGGTDYVAVALGAVLGCPVRFRKGSGKIYAVDPSVLPNALPLDQLTYGQARSFVEYSRPERQFLAMKSLDLAAHYHVPLYFLPEFESDISKGTSIGVAHEMPDGRQFVTKPFRALAVQDVYLVDLKIYPPKTPTHLYKALQKLGISCSDTCEVRGRTFVDRDSLYFTIRGEDIDSVRKLLERHHDYCEYGLLKFYSLTLIDSSITPNGDHILRSRKALQDIVGVRLSTSFGNTIRFIVKSKDRQIAVKALAKEFGLTK